MFYDSSCDHEDQTEDVSFYRPLIESQPFVPQTDALTEMLMWSVFCIHVSSFK